MLACKHCSTPNSLDSTFCKKCGTAVPADGKREALLQLDKLVEEGLAALAAGRTVEALAIADSAVATDPTHLGALHLKAAVHERRGEIADALQSAERIVELNPDSELDRIKRNGLRTSLLNASAPVAPDRRVAFAAAAAAIVLVACVGVLLARRPTSQPVASMRPTGPVVDSPVVLTPAPTSEAAPTTPNASAPEPTEALPSGGIAPTPVARPSLSLPRNPGFTRLPDPTGLDSLGGPIDPTSGIGMATPAEKTTVAPKGPTTPPRRGGDPDPRAVRETTDPREDPGQIDISVTRDAGRRMGGSVRVPETRTNGTAAYTRVGTEKFELGDYAGAATNLEKAVAGGGDPIDLNRRLAQAYGHLGRNSDAAAAYERSRAAAVSALASGKGDRERLQSARDAAEAGLKTVRGN